MTHLDLLELEYLHAFELVKENELDGINVDIENLTEKEYNI